MSGDWKARLGIIAALDGEVAPLVRGWRREANGAFRTERNGALVIAVAKGMGAARAVDAVRTAEAFGPLTALASIGWAGGASCGVQPGEAYAVAEVVDAATRERFRTATAEGSIRLATLEHVAGREEKRRAAETLGVSLVDMEAAAVARAAAAAGIPLYCWKAVTDIATEEMPDFNRFLDGEKQLMTARLAAYVVTHPRFVGPLVRMGRNGKRGAEALMQAVERWIDEGGYADSND